MTAMVLDQWSAAAVAEQAATALTAAAVIIAAAVWVTVRAWQPTMPILLELLLAAGLLRLSASDTWGAIAAAGAIVAIRTVIRVGSDVGAQDFGFSIRTVLRSRALAGNRLARGRKSADG